MKALSPLSSAKTVFLSPRSGGVFRRSSSVRFLLLTASLASISPAVLRYKSPGARGFLVKLREFQYLENYTASEKGMADAEAWDRAAALQEELENQYGDLFQKWYDADWERQMAEGSETVITPGDLYRNTAGSVL